MKKNFAENKFGHGGIRNFSSKIKTKARRFIRPKLGMATIPFNWDLGFHIQEKIGVIPKKNQGKSSSCGGQAKSYWLGVINSIITGQPYSEQSAKSIYSPISYPNGGTTVPALERDLGALDESLLPSYLQSGQLPDEIWMTDKSWRTDSNIKLAMNKAGWLAISVNIDMESIAEAIRDYGAIVWEVTGQNNGTWLSNNPKPPEKSNTNPKWNHFMCSEGAGIWNFKESIDMFQSWGNEVGDQGIQHFTDDYINSGYIIDCFTFVKKKPKFIFNNDLKYGDKNNDVLELQKRLGVMQTGYFGLLTYAAVLVYQKWNKLPATGYVGILTRTKLNET